MFVPGKVWADNLSIFHGIKVKNSVKFVQIRFLFLGSVPRRTDAYLKGRTLALSFHGTRLRGFEKPVANNRGLIRGVTVYRSPQGINVRVNLRYSDIEYVKYQRKDPSQVIISLRRKILRRTVRRQKSGKSAIGGRRTHFRGHGAIENPGQARRKAKRGSLSAKSREKISAARPPSSKKRPVQELFLKAKKAWEGGDYRRASVLFYQVKEKFPNSSEGETSAFYWVRTQFLMEKKRKTLVVAEFYEDILKRFPKASWATQALRDLGEQYTFLGLYNRAIGAYQRILKQFPGSPDEEEALFRIGKLHLFRHSYKEAEKTFRGYLSRYPKGRHFKDATYLLGDALLYQGDIRLAVETYQIFMKPRPHSASTYPRTLEDISAFFEKKGQYERALNLMFTALNVFSSGRDSAELMFRIAALYERHGRFREALKVYSRVLAQYTGSQEAVESRMRMATLLENHPGIRHRGFQNGIDTYRFHMHSNESILKGQKNP